MEWTEKELEFEDYITIMRSYYSSLVYLTHVGLYAINRDHRKQRSVRKLQEYYQYWSAKYNQNIDL